MLHNITEPLPCRGGGPVPQNVFEGRAATQESWSLKTGVADQLAG